MRSPFTIILLLKQDKRSKQVGEALFLLREFADTQDAQMCQVNCLDRAGIPFACKENPRLVKLFGLPEMAEERMILIRAL